MGTTLYDKNGINIRRFYGGDERGVCYQITIGKEYVQLTGEQFIEFLFNVFLKTLWKI